MCACVCVCVYVSVCVCVCAQIFWATFIDLSKESYISSKEPYISAKETYISANDRCFGISSKERPSRRCLGAETDL